MHYSTMIKPKGAADSNHSVGVKNDDRPPLTNVNVPPDDLSFLYGLFGLILANVKSTFPNQKTKNHEKG